MDETYRQRPIQPNDYINIEHSVGLHPMAVIVSIFVWGLIIDGVIGPLFTVPLAATLKVFLARCVRGQPLFERALRIETTVTSKAIELPTHHQRKHQQA